MNHLLTNLWQNGNRRQRRTSTQSRGNVIWRLEKFVQEYRNLEGSRESDAPIVVWLDPWRRSSLALRIHVSKIRIPSLKPPVCCRYSWRATKPPVLWTEKIIDVLRRQMLFPRTIIWMRIRRWSGDDEIWRDPCFDCRKKRPPSCLTSTVGFRNCFRTIPEFPVCADDPACPDMIYRTLWIFIVDDGAIFSLFFYTRHGYRIRDHCMMTSRLHLSG